MSYKGACHCGAVKVAFESAMRPAEIEVRADQCSFCKARGAKTVSDPHGLLQLRFARDAAHAYRFGLKTADFWICNTCGAYVAATTEIENRLFGVVNVAATGIGELSRQLAKPVDYSKEDAAARNARRRARWTPAQIVH